jgi:N6-adenosine-specific RNA methylase IME4
VGKVREARVTLARRPAPPVALLKVEEARKLLALCERVDEVKQIRDAAQAVRAYYKQRKDGQAAAGSATEICLRADRRAGELLLKQEKAPAGRKSNGNRLPAATDSPPTYREQGIDKTWAKWSQDVARIDSADFEAEIRKKKEKGESSLVSLTSRDIVKVVRELKREEKLEGIAEEGAKMAPLAGTKPCPVVYADPPWQYGNTAGASAAADQYPTMPLADICALKVPATKDAVLFLWATSPLLPEALQVVTTWGFTYKGSMVWDKGSGTGNWVLNAHELLLIAVRGDMPCPAPANRPVSIIRTPASRHSEKPEAFAEAIERMFPGLPRVEMFARRTRVGWSAWGNEAA